MVKPKDHGKKDCIMEKAVIVIMIMCMEIIMLILAMRKKYSSIITSTNSKFICGANPSVGPEKERKYPEDMIHIEQYNVEQFIDEHQEASVEATEGVPKNKDVHIYSIIIGSFEILILLNDS